MTPGAAASDAAALIERLVLEYHEPELEMLDRLGEALYRETRAHIGPGPQSVATADQVEAAFGALASELASHFRKEENVLFPLLLRALEEPELASMVRGPVAAMAAEHRALPALTGGLTAALRLFPGATESAATLAALVAHLSDHMRVEDEELFPRMR